jgi:hypothetical protein
MRDVVLKGMRARCVVVEEMVPNDCITPPHRRLVVGRGQHADDAQHDGLHSLHPGVAARELDPFAKAKALTRISRFKVQGLGHQALLSSAMGQR